MNLTTKKYIELLGSEEFNSYLRKILYSKLELDRNPQWQAFTTDLLFNACDLSSTGRMRSIPLERFIFVMLQLENPSFYKGHEEIQKMFLMDLEYTYNVKDNSQIYKLVENQEYMLHFNLLLLSKNHNFFA
jgi:hypothetical protein